MELEPFSYYFVITKTLNLNNEKYKLVYLEKYYQKKNRQRPYWTTLSMIYKMVKENVVILHIYGSRAIFLLFCDPQDTESEL